MSCTPPCTRWAAPCRRLRGVFAVALFGLLLARVAGAAETATADTVVNVEVRGLRRVDREAALGAVRLRPHVAFDAATATTDLRAVWGTGFFADVKLYCQRSAQGIRLIYEVSEKPSVKSVVYSGLDALSEDDVKAVVDVKPFTILNVELLQKNVAKIKDLYVGKGFYLVEVGYHLTPISRGVDGQEVEVSFDVVEHAKVVVRQVSLLGNQALSDAQIKAAMQTREGDELSFITQSGTYKEEDFQNDLLRIQALYYDHGYVAVKVGQPVATLSRDRREIYLALTIEEGDCYSFGEITFAGDVELHGKDGALVIDAARLRSHLQVAVGDQFSRTKLFEDVQVLTDIYRDEGYAFANVTPNSRVDPQTRKVTLEMEVDRGDEVSFEKIEIAGNTRTRDKVIRRELRIFEGERYSAAAVNLSRARIFQLGYFETVNITTQRGSRADLLSVTVEVKEKSTGTFQIGAGLSSYESFIATAQISQNNFLGNGQMMALSMHLSFGQFAQKFFQFQFQEPYFLDSRWALGLNAYIAQRGYLDFVREAQGVSPSFGLPLSHEWRLSAGYTFEFVSIGTNNAVSNNNVVLAGLDRAGKVSSLNLGVSYDTRDNRLFPSRGTFDELRGEFSSTFLGADEPMAFKRIELDARVYQPLFLGAVFRFDMRLGLVFGPSMGAPVSERYFPGGITTVRGFPPTSLGPIVRVARDSENPLSQTRDFSWGGNKQAIFNVEVEFPLIAAAGLRGVVFVDAGNAYDDNEDFFYLGTPQLQRSPGYLMGSNAQLQVPLGLFYSFGFGVRWLSPIGPLRFEWGIPITKRAIDDQPMIFEFTIGNFF